MTYTFEAARALPVFYSWLRQRPGVSFEQRKVGSIGSDLAGFDFVVNCSGSGAKELVDDYFISTCIISICRGAVAQLVERPSMVLVCCNSTD